jgi:hypothetical protein
MSSDTAARPERRNLWRAKAVIREAAQKGAEPSARSCKTYSTKKIAVTENGKTRRIPTLEVMFRWIVNDAARRDPVALKLLLPLIDRYASSLETELRLDELLAEDQAILSQYLSRPAGPASDCATESKTEQLGDGL